MILPMNMGCGTIQSNYQFISNESKTHTMEIALSNSQLTSASKKKMARIVRVFFYLIYQ
jgi:hypothetical protein